MVAPADIANQGENYYLRVVCYHNPDEQGGVTVEFDDVSCVLSGQEPNVPNVIFPSVNVIPNPSFDFPGVITSNPVSHFRDVMEGPADALAVDDSRLDLPGLVDWWMDCNANSRNNNMICDRANKVVFDTLREIAAMGRASLTMKDGLYSVVRDLPQAAPVQHFTPRNSWGFKSTRSFPQLPGVLLVDFINPAANWTRDTNTVYDDGYSASSPNLLPERLDLSNGVTDPNQAWRDGRYHLAQARLRPETYELTVDVENIVCNRGDLVYVSHDVPRFGLGSGRIKAVELDRQGNAIGITTDEQFFFGAGAYAVRIRRSDGSSMLLPVVNPSLSSGPPVRRRRRAAGNRLRLAGLRQSDPGWAGDSGGRRSHHVRRAQRRDRPAPRDQNHARPGPHGGAGAGGLRSRHLPGRPRHPAGIRGVKPRFQ